MKWRRKAQRRFHELAVKEALGTATIDDTVKLERYQKLLRYKPNSEETHAAEMHFYQATRAIKTLKGLLRKALV